MTDTSATSFVWLQCSQCCYRAAHIHMKLLDSASPHTNFFFKPSTHATKGNICHTELSLQRIRPFHSSSRPSWCSTLAFLFFKGDRSQSWTCSQPDCYSYVNYKQPFLNTGRCWPLAQPKWRNSLFQTQNKAITVHSPKCIHYFNKV